MERSYLLFIIPPSAARKHLICTTTVTFEQQDTLPQVAVWINIHRSAFQHHTDSALKGHMDLCLSMYELPWLHIEVDEEHVSRLALCRVLSSTDICRVGEEGRRRSPRKALMSVVTAVKTEIMIRWLKISMMSG